MSAAPRSRVGLCALAAAVVAVGGCSLDQPLRAPVVARQDTATVEHWGSFFGGWNDINYDTQTSPVDVTTMPVPAASPPPARVVLMSTSARS